MVEKLLDFRGMENYFSQHAYDVMTSEEFHNTFANIAKEHGVEPQDFFDQYLMVITGRPITGYTEDDVEELQWAAVDSGFLTTGDIKVISAAVEIIGK